MRQKTSIDGLPAIIRTAHGAAADGGAILVAELAPLDELPPPDASRTVTGLAISVARGRPFQPGNRAAADRGSSLTRITVDPDATEERARVHRKAQSLVGQRRREMEVQHGGRLSSAVRVELVAWARATAWADHFDRQGDATKAAALSEKASGHQLKAIGFAERDAASRPKVSTRRHWGLPDAGTK